MTLERDENTGRWTSKAKAKGLRNALMDAITYGDMKEVVKKVIEQAKGGCFRSQQLLTSWVTPRVVERDEPHEGPTLTQMFMNFSPEQLQQLASNPKLLESMKPPETIEEERD
jgi:hypothetical protein